MTDDLRMQLQPVLRRVLFWDTPLENIDVDHHADWLIARVLWRGQLDDVRRVLRVYGAPRVAAVAATHRSLPPSFRAFWGNVLADEEEPMHPETLAPATQSALAQHGTALCPPGFLLCGGTAVALYLGHRRSVDLDLFTATAFDAPTLAGSLMRTLPQYTVDAVSSGTVHGRLGDVQVSHIHQVGITLTPGPSYEGVPVASLDALCAMTCHALSMRGARKAFIDVYALALAAGGITPVLRRAFAQAPQMNRVHVLRSLTAFEEAEAQPMPDMVAPWSWDTIRDAMTQFAHHEARRQLGLSSPAR